MEEPRVPAHEVKKAIYLYLLSLGPKGSSTFHRIFHSEYLDALGPTIWSDHRFLDLIEEMIQEGVITETNTDQYKVVG